MKPGWLPVTRIVLRSAWASGRRILLAGLVTVSASAGNWPAWRGPQGTGFHRRRTCRCAGAPAKASAGASVARSIPLPSSGATASSSRRRSKAGTAHAHVPGSARWKLLWQSGVNYRKSSRTDESQCAASPVTDGERVIASFGSAGLYCYDFSGKELWHRNLENRSTFGAMAHRQSSTAICAFSISAPVNGPS